MALGPLLRKMSGIPREPVCRGSAWVFVDYITIIVNEMEHLEGVGEAIKGYETVAGSRINRGKPVDLQLGTWRSKSRPSNSVVDRGSSYVFRDLARSRSSERERLERSIDQGAHHQK